MVNLVVFSTSGVDGSAIRGVGLLINTIFIATILFFIALIYKRDNKLIVLNYLCYSMLAFIPAFVIFTLYPYYFYLTLLVVIVSQFANKKWSKSIKKKDYKLGSVILQITPLYLFVLGFTLLESISSGDDLLLFIKGNFPSIDWTHFASFYNFALGTVLAVGTLFTLGILFLFVNEVSEVCRDIQATKNADDSKAMIQMVINVIADGYQHYGFEQKESEILIKAANLINDNDEILREASWRICNDPSRASQVFRRISRL